MQTAKLIYLSIPALVVIPQVAFNFKRIFIRKPGEKVRGKGQWFEIGR